MHIIWGINLWRPRQNTFVNFLVKARKSLDDVFVFIFALVVFVATRALWLWLLRAQS
ncbi:hypothetical protein BBP00_00009147, partial [Phytophthora kernoviae]